MFDKIITVNELEIFQHCRLEKKMKVRTVNMNRKELIEKRSINTKVFENQDHSCTAEIYLAPVHYKDTDGTWKEMDNKLDIKAFLDKDEQKDLLRLLTAGSVDDGKSTLIGRLLFDSKKLYEDQLISREEYEKSDVSAKQAREELSTAKDNLEIVKEGITKNSASFSRLLINSLS